MPEQFVTFCTYDEIPPGEREVFDLEYESIILFNVDGTIYALENRCSHQDVELADGEFVDTCELKCSAHGATFDIRTGEALSRPAYTPVKTYPVRIEGNNVQVKLDLD